MSSQKWSSVINETTDYLFQMKNELDMCHVCGDKFSVTTDY